MNQDLVKLDRFDGNNYARWKDKIMFLLSALRISYILDPELSPAPEEPRTSAEGVPPDVEEFERVKKERKKREEDELLCRGHILNGLSNCLCDLFTEIKSARDIWSALDYKYKAKEEGTNKYLIAQYFDFVMVDDKLVLEQVHALQVIVNKIRALKISLPELFQVGAIIAKLPPSWKDYKKKLLHKSEDFTFEQFQKHLRIEKESRKRENKVTVLVEYNVHYVDGSGSQSKNPALQARKNDEQFKKKVESRDVEFFENKFSTDYEVINDDSQGNGPNEPLGLERQQGDQLSDSRIQPTEPRRSTRTRKEKELNSDFVSSQSIVFLVEGDRDNNVINKYPIVLNLENDPRVIVCLYVDDMLIFGTNLYGINETNEYLSSMFKMKDLVR
ncbi:hypothetical protein RJ639_016028 [Escallonia herrerae]|uniref:Uncharacterized protein n=1 Tax=Escallonia herrerae TaxID=1293975 RepID=A0AA88VER0_9ASTE|nr:hypothetical protein RJ639_016028 [Escallonia herrerae]